MRWMCCALVVISACSSALRADEPPVERQSVRGKLNEVLETRTYAVADVVVPLPSTGEKKTEFAALERYLREVTSSAVWNDQADMKSHEKTLSLVIRQTPTVHAKIAAAIDELRRSLDVQAVVQFHVVTGPRREIAALAEAYPGEFGKAETEELLQRVSESKQFHLIAAPKITSFSRQTVQIMWDGRAIHAHATVAPDRRSVQLKVTETPEKNGDLLAAMQTVTLHSGRTAALRFEAPRAGGIIPPAADAEERLLVVTARVIVTEEVEEQPAVVLMDTSRGPYIQEEEEELLGIPTE